MSETLLAQVLSMLKALEEDNRKLRQRIEELSNARTAPVSLSEISLSRRLQYLSQEEPSSNSKRTLSKAVDSILQYAKSVGFI